MKQALVQRFRTELHLHVTWRVSKRAGVVVRASCNAGTITLGGEPTHATTSEAPASKRRRVGLDGSAASGALVVAPAAPTQTSSDIERARVYGPALTGVVAAVESQVLAHRAAGALLLAALQLRAHGFECSMSTPTASDGGGTAAVQFRLRLGTGGQAAGTVTVSSAAAGGGSGETGAVPLVATMRWLGAAAGSDSPSTDGALQRTYTGATAAADVVAVDLATAALRRSYLGQLVDAVQQLASANAGEAPPATATLDGWDAVTLRTGLSPHTVSMGVTFTPLVFAPAAGAPQGVDVKHGQVYDGVGAFSVTHCDAALRPAVATFTTALNQSVGSLMEAVRSLAMCATPLAIVHGVGKPHRTRVIMRSCVMFTAVVDNAIAVHVRCDTKVPHSVMVSDAAPPRSLHTAHVTYRVWQPLTELRTPLPASVPYTASSGPSFATVLAEMLELWIPMRANVYSAVNRRDHS